MDKAELEELKRGVSAMGFIALSRLRDKGARDNIVKYGTAMQDLIDTAIAQPPTPKEMQQMSALDFEKMIIDTTCVRFNDAEIANTDTASEDVENVILDLKSIRDYLQSESQREKIDRAIRALQAMKGARHD